jgi:hypothetical protein
MRSAAVDAVLSNSTIDSINYTTAAVLCVKRQDMEIIDMFLHILIHSLRFGLTSHKARTHINKLFIYYTPQQATANCFAIDYGEFNFIFLLNRQETFVLRHLLFIYMNELHVHRVDGCENICCALHNTFPCLGHCDRCACCQENGLIATA